MRRLLPIVALVVALGACGESGSGSGSAAGVNGENISNQSVVSELEAIAGNADYLAGVEGQVPVTGQTPGSFDAAFAAQVLTRQIKFALVGQEVRARNLEVDDECRQAARTDVLRQMGNDPAAGEALFEVFPESYQEQLVEWNADVLALQGDLVGQACTASEAVAQEYYDNHMDEFVQTCASHILVATQPEADEIVAQLQAGADFATLASDLSTDEGSAVNGGSIGCFTPGSGQLVPEFDAAAAALEIGQTDAPVQTEFGWHVIQVTDRKTPPFEEVATEVQQTVGELIGAGFGTFLEDAIANAEITVDARYGTWDAQAGEVTSPDASAPTTEN